MGKCGFPRSLEVVKVSHLAALIWQELAEHARSPPFWCARNAIATQRRMRVQIHVNHIADLEVDCSLDQLARPGQAHTAFCGDTPTGRSGDRHDKSIAWHLDHAAVARKEELRQSHFLGELYRANHAEGEDPVLFGLVPSSSSLLSYASGEHGLWRPTRR